MVGNGHDSARVHCAAHFSRSRWLLALLQSGRGQTYEGRELVKAQLLADTDRHRSRQSRLRPAFFCTWRRTGIPIGNSPATPGCRPRSNGRCRPDWKAGEIQWPIPLRLKDPGDIETYGYRKRSAPPAGDHPAGLALWFLRQIVGRSELARLRKALHSGQRETSARAPGCRQECTGE